MAYKVTQHPTQPKHFYVNGMLVAGAKDAADAVRIFEEAMAGGD